MKMSAKESSLETSDDLQKLQADIERALAVMPAIDAAAWQHTGTVARIFGQAEYETIYNLLLAYRQLTK